MTEITKYICDYCHTEYETSEKCAACEAYHVAPTSYDDPTYSPCAKYPTHVFMTASDNHFIEYVFHNDLGAVPEDEEEETENNEG